MTSNFTVRCIGNVGRISPKYVYSVSAPGTKDFIVTPSEGTATFLEETLSGGAIKRLRVHCTKRRTDFLLDVVKRSLETEIN